MMAEVWPETGKGRALEREILRVAIGSDVEMIRNVSARLRAYAKNPAATPDLVTVLRALSDALDGASVKVKGLANSQLR